MQQVNEWLARRRMEIGLSPRLTAPKLLSLAAVHLFRAAPQLAARVSELAPM